MISSAGKSRPKRVSAEELKPSDPSLQTIWVVSVPTYNLVPSIAEVEARHIAATLIYCEGNKTKAAQLLGIDRRTLYRKVRALGGK